MKKILTLLLLAVATITVNAQTPPEAFNYSAVARDANSNPIANSTIGIQISIKVGSPLGNTVYQENHFVNTDDFGLFNLVVGGGSILSGTIADIDWGADDYYLQVGMDANGGTNFLSMGSTQLLSVPYALYAKSAGSAGGIQISSISTDGDTLYLSNGQTFVNGSNGGGNNGTLPTVTTAAATNIYANQAVVGGDVTSSGGELVFARGVCYSTSANPTVNDETAVSGGVGTGAFTASLGGLQTGTTYYAKAYATNVAGTAYGNEVSFATPAIGAITTLDCNGATLNGTLVSYSPFNAGLTVPYTGGNGGLHNGQTVTSTGVTGLTATLVSGQFTIGSGTLSYQISGTPSGPGTASFALDIGGQQCTVDLPAGDLGCQGGLCVGQQYQGGIIAYLLQPGDPGYDANTPHGIIAAPTDQSTGAEWGCYGTLISGADGTAVGTGNQNTIDIEAGCTTAGTAADICANLTLNGYSDWYLPSIDELEQLYLNLHVNGIAAFATEAYWSSTEDDAFDAWFFYFYSGVAIYTSKLGTVYVRAVRAF